MDAAGAADDLSFIRAVMDRAQRRIDPHAFHFVHWGALVLVCYPAMNLLERAGEREAMAWTGGAMLLAGMLLSMIREWRLSRKPRLAGGESLVERQVLQVVWGSLGPAALVSFVGPATGFIRGPDTAIVWGFAYANLAFMVGVVYSREYLRSGLFILSGTILAMVFREWSGVILGPFMGLGLIVPGLMAERRVRAMAAEEAGAGIAG
jgi:hypothetical protein